MDVLDSARIGKKVELKKYQNKFWQGLERFEKVWKELKNDKNEYKSSLGGHRQKPIDALNLARIGVKMS
jgi:hypothetical protein